LNTFDIVLYQPEIPPNTGNVIRLAANTGSGLHLIEPLGFRMEDRQLRRAGLDYHEFASVRTYADLTDCARLLGERRWIAFSTRGEQPYDEIEYRAGDVLLFGPETRGLPDSVMAGFPPEQRARIPLRPGNRSLNLSNAVAVAVYEAWRQLGFAGGC
jgi:tRNA (cytidine/uridine-2'-O-)-methyltransferase